MLCDDLKVWDGGWEEGSGRKGYTYTCTLDCTAETQHCKGITLQLKTKKNLKFLKIMPIFKHASVMCFQN